LTPEYLMVATPPEPRKTEAGHDEWRKKR